MVSYSLHGLCDPLRVAQGGQAEYRRVRVPHHRYTPLREEWDTIVSYIVEHMKLQIRMNTKMRTVELKVSGSAQVSLPRRGLTVACSLPDDSRSLGRQHPEGC